MDLSAVESDATHDLEQKTSQIDYVMIKESTVVSRGEDNMTFDPEDRIFERHGLLDLVFPNGNNVKQHSIGGGCDDYKDKLSEFIHYQALQTYLADPVPDGIPLSSKEGRAMLREALGTPYMESYVTVTPQIEHQPENVCGTMSLVVALNSLGIDPGRPNWYGVYRFHHLGSLLCCQPHLQNPNITLDQLACLSVCNDTNAFPVIVTDDWTLDQLRSWIKMATNRSDIVMVMNYGRREMKQKGSGHFLPLSGYHESRDMFLLVDIAKHKYWPCWIPLHLLLKAMKAKDDRSGLNRGFVLLKRTGYEPSDIMFRPSLLFRLDNFPGRVDKRLISFMSRWNGFLNQVISSDTNCYDVIKKTIQTFWSFIPWDDMESPFSLLDMTSVYFRSDPGVRTSIVARCRIPQCPASCQNHIFCQQLQSLKIFRYIKLCLESWTDEDYNKVLDLVVGQFSDIDQAVKVSKSTLQGKNIIVDMIAGFFHNLYSKPDTDSKIHSLSPEDTGGSLPCPGYVELFPEHILTFIMLAWPFWFDVDTDDILGQRSFLPMIKKYDVSPLVVDFNNNNKSPQPTNDSQGTADKSDTKRIRLDDQVTVRDKMDHIVNEDLEKVDCHFLQEQVRVLKRKLLVVLDYHNLM